MKGVPVGTWYFDPNRPRRSRKGTYSPHKVFLYEVIHRSLTRHNIAECCWVLKILPRMTNIDPYVTFRFVMIMIHCVDEKLINKNFMIYLEALISKLELTKPDIFLEFLTYFFSNNRLDDARDLFTQRHRFMSYLYHRQFPLVNSNLGCYALLFNYLDWKERVSNQSAVKFDVSMQGWLVNAMGHLKHSAINHELFVMCVAEVLLYYGFYKKVYLFLSEFQKTNQDNIAAQLLLYNLIKGMNEGTPKRQRTDPTYYLAAIVSDKEASRKRHRDKELEAINNFSADECNENFDLQDYPILSDKKSLLDNLLRLDQRREEVFELAATYSTRVDALRLIMDSLEHVSEMRLVSKWRFLQSIIDQILSSKDEALIEEVRTLWQTRYHPFWHLEEFLVLAADENSSDTKVKHRKVIKKVIRTLKSEFDPSNDAPAEQDQQQTDHPDDYYDIDCLEDSE